VFLRKKKGEKSPGDNKEWMDLTKEVDKYASMAGDDHNNVSDSSSEEDTDDNKSEGRRGNAPIDTEIDSEQEQADEVMVDECEAWAE
jgi:hypothetical protein